MSQMTGAALVARLNADLPALPFAAALFDVIDGRFALRDLNADAAEGLGIEKGTLLPEGSASALPEALMRCYLDKARQSATLSLGGADCSVGLSPLCDRDGDVIAILAQWTTPLGRTVSVPARAEPTIRELASEDLSVPREANFALIDLCRQAMARGTGKRKMTPTIKAAPAVTQDFALLCQSLADELDPSARFAISFGEGQINADPNLVRHCLKQLLTRALERAETFVSIDVNPLGDDLLFEVEDDGRSPLSWTSAWGGRIASLNQLLQDQNGHLTIMSLGDVPGQVAQLTLPGSFQTRTLSSRRSRAVSA